MGIGGLSELTDIAQSCITSHLFLLSARSHVEVSDQHQIAAALGVQDEKERLAVR